MNKVEFVLYYDGDSLRDGIMDVKQLAPALLALGDLLDESNKVLNSDETTIKVNVKAGFEAGSFGVELEIVQNLFNQVANLFTRENISTASDLLGILGIGGGGVGGIWFYLKKLRGRKPQKTIQNKDGSVVLEIVEGETVSINKKEATLMQNPKVRKSIEQVVKPLESEGIDTIKVKFDEEYTPLVAKNEASYFKAPEPEVVQKDEDNAITEISNEMSLSLITINFKEDKKWRMSDGESQFWVTISDKNFISKVENSEISFSKGDILRVKLVTKQWKIAGGIETQYEIVKVLRHENPPQLKLPYS